MSVEMTYVEVDLNDPEVRADLRGFAKAWWLFLVTGILWLIVSLAVLQFDQTSINTIKFLVGLVMILATIEEAFHAIILPGWRWAHALLALLFLAVTIAVFTYPAMTFGTLAILIAWFLLVRGAFEIVASIMNRDLDLWWLGLIAGIAQVLIAFWAIGYPGRSAFLLVLWVGLGAMFRGIEQIVMAFQVKKLAKEMV